MDHSEAGIASTLMALQPSVAAFLGAIVGATITMVSVIVGALFNAHLNRRRDDRIRKQEERTVANALLAELTMLRGSHSRAIAERQPQGNTMLIPVKEGPAEVYHALIDKIGHLDSSVLVPLIEFHTVFASLESYLVFLGGKVEIHGQKRYVAVPDRHYDKVNIIMQSLVKYADKAIMLLKKEANFEQGEHRKGFLLRPAYTDSK